MLTEVSSTRQLLIELSPGGELEDDIDALLVPEVAVHAQDILLPINKTKQNKTKQKCNKIIMIGHRWIDIIYLTLNETGSRSLFSADAPH